MTVVTVPGERDEIMDLDRLLRHSMDSHRPWVPEPPLILKLILSLVLTYLLYDNENVGKIHPKTFRGLQSVNL